MARLARSRRSSRSAMADMSGGVCALRAADHRSENRMTWRRRVKQGKLKKDLQNSVAQPLPNRVPSGLGAVSAVPSAHRFRAARVSKRFLRTLQFPVKRAARLVGGTIQNLLQFPPH